MNRNRRLAATNQDQTSVRGYSALPCAKKQRHTHKLRLRDFPAGTRAEVGQLRTYGHPETLPLTVIEDHRRSQKRLRNYSPSSRAGASKSRSERRSHTRRNLAGLAAGRERNARVGRNSRNGWGPFGNSFLAKSKPNLAIEVSICRIFIQTITRLSPDTSLLIQLRTGLGKRPNTSSRW